MRNKYIVIGILGVVTVVVLGGIALLFISGAANKAEEARVRQRTLPIELTLWGVYDTTDAFSGIISEYRKGHPNVQVTYKKFRPEEYEQMILEGLAEDRGPDLFMIDESWLPRYRSKILPAPQSVVLPVQAVGGPSFRREVKYSLATLPVITAQQIKDEFVGSVYSSVVDGNTVLGLPFSLDSLILLYNRELLNQAHLTRPPKSWDEFKSSVQATTRADSQGKLVQAGVALGAASSVPHSADIISLLMLQNGTNMVSRDGSQATFASASSNDQNYRPGAEALRFYTDFANPTKEVYTWNNTFGDAYDAFAAGKVAFVFAYARDVPTIRAKNAQLDFGISPVPQLSAREVNYASFWPAVVSRKTKYPDEAWNFLDFATSPEHVLPYITATKQAPAVRTVIEQVKGDPELGTAAVAALTAQTWYHGSDSTIVETAFNDMVNQVLDGRMTPEAAVSKAAQAVTKTL